MPAEASGADRSPVTRPRPGHADLAGFVKYGHEDMRNVLERASARETAARVAVGAIARQLLRSVGAEIVSHVVADRGRVRRRSARAHLRPGAGDRRRRAAPLRRCVGRAADDRRDRSRRATPATRWAARFEVIVHGVPPGLGSYVQWDRKLDGRLAQALMSIPAIKAVGIGRGPGVAERARLARPRRDPAGAPAADAPIAARAADQQRRRARGRRHQRRGPARHRRT